MNKISKNEEASDEDSNKNIPSPTKATPPVNSSKSTESEFPAISIMVGYFFYYLITLVLALVAGISLQKKGYPIIGFLAGVAFYFLSVFLLIIAAPNPNNKRIGIKLVFAVWVFVVLNKVCGPLY